MDWSGGEAGACVLSLCDLKRNDKFLSPAPQKGVPH